ncbi:GNAT family N-acetyltransferase [Gillisia sp. JM1]|uniref:GNAT family N-acetyltransferase n=1 Tax=Gillisia sp. JM1 TaxID=1283286 RepID=UPI00040D5983|nr:GNAT family N-acetyltransferase [Gillisia sp. JM1]
MKFIETKNLSVIEKQAIFKLWNQEYPKSLAYSKMEEFEAYLNKLSESYHVLVKDELDTILGWYSDFKRDNEIWFAMILDDSIQKKGIGTILLNTAKKRNENLNGWVIDHKHNPKTNGSIYKSPLKFYMKNEFQLLPEVRLELPIISAVKIYWSK